MDSAIIEEIDLENFHICPICNFLGTTEQVKEHLENNHTNEESWWME